MAKKRGLGRGIDSVIVSNHEEIQAEEEKSTKKAQDMVDINLVEPNREQPRKTFNQERLEELAESIKEHGIVQPLIVIKKEDYYEIIAGERRWRAAKIAKLKKIPVIVKDYTPQEAMEVALIENIQREDLNPIEEALAYQSLIEEYDLKQAEVAERVSKNRSTITNVLRLLNLTPEVQDLLIEEKIQSGHARALLGLDKEADQKMLAKKIVAERLSVRQTEQLVKTLNEGKKPKKKKDSKELQRAAGYKKYADTLSKRIGTKVSIKRKSDHTGKIEIDYHSLEDFERIYDLIIR